METAAISTSVFCVAGVPLRISADDPGFLDEFASLFGSGVAASTASGIDAELNASDRTLSVRGDGLSDPAAFLLRFSSPDIPIDVHERSTDSRPVLSVAGRPMFTFDGDAIHFGDHPRWRRMLAHVLFLRALRLRSDAIFLHAASVAVGGKGVLLIGPKGTGKTTLSAAFASRGHAFLGDETAMYLPASGMLAPFLRPLSMKRGPAAAAVTTALDGRWNAADEDGVLRVSIESIGGTAATESAPLHSVFFLRTFEREPRVERLPAVGREEIAALQPLGSTVVSDNAAQHVFALFRMLANRAVFHLWPGDPDRTAAVIEEAIGSS